MTRCIWCNRLITSAPTFVNTKDESVCINCTNGIANKTCVRCGLTYFSKIKFNTRKGNVCCTCSNFQKQNIY